jgi:hypothetical protein
MKGKVTRLLQTIKNPPHIHVTLKGTELIVLQFYTKFLATCMFISGSVPIVKSLYNSIFHESVVWWA